MSIGLSGITRLERWTRAQNHGLEPPPDVKKIIEEHTNDTKFTQWFVYSIIAIIIIVINETISNANVLNDYFLITVTIIH